MLKRLLVVPLTLIGIPSLQAHDFWVRPSEFLVPPDSLIAVRILVGDHLRGSPLGRDPSHIRQFVVQGPNGIEEIPGRTGGDPAGLLRPRTPGSYVIGYRSQRRISRLPGPAFNNYLEEEDLQAILEVRRLRGEEEKEGVEAYSRCAKALLVVEGEAPPWQDRLLGFDLELVAELHPAHLGPDRVLPVRIVYQGSPLENHPLRATWEKDPAVVLDVRSDADGRARFELPRPGAWMIRALHMVAAEAGEEFDWESFWASLSFEIPVEAPGASP